MLERGGGAGLVLEPLQMSGIEDGGKGQDLQRDPAPQRNLLRLVHDAHAAASDFAHDAEIAQHALDRTQGCTMAPARGRRADGRQADLVEHLKRGHESPQALGQVGVLGLIRGEVHRLARLHGLRDLLQEIGEGFFLQIDRV